MTWFYVLIINDFLIIQMNGIFVQFKEMEIYIKKREINKLLKTNLPNQSLVCPDYL